MKKMILGWFLYGTAVGLCAQAPQGDFKGSIQIGQTTMPIVFHFVINSETASLKPS